MNLYGEKIRINGYLLFIGNIVPNRCAVAQQYLPFSGPNLYI